MGRVNIDKVERHEVTLDFSPLVRQFPFAYLKEFVAKVEALGPDSALHGLIVNVRSGDLYVEVPSKSGAQKRC